MNWKFWHRKSRVQTRADRVMEVVDNKRVRAAAAAIAPALFALAARARVKTTGEKKP